MCCPSSRILTYSYSRCVFKFGRNCDQVLELTSWCSLSTSMVLLATCGHYCLPVSHLNAVNRYLHGPTFFKDLHFFHPALNIGNILHYNYVNFTHLRLISAVFLCIRSSVYLFSLSRSLLSLSCLSFILLLNLANSQQDGSSL